MPLVVVANANAASSAANTRADAFDTTVFVMVLLGLAWVPLWLGSNRMMAWGINGILFAGLLIVYEGSRLLQSREPTVLAAKVGIPLVLFACVLAWIVVQMSPYVPAPLIHPIWPLASQTLTRPLPGSISVNTGASALGLIRLLTDASVFWLSLQLCRQPWRAIWLLHAISAIVACYAALALVLTAFFASAIPYLDGPAAGLVRSTFVNRNTFAAYCGMGAIASLTLILRTYRKQVSQRGEAGPYEAAFLLQIMTASGWFLIGSGLIAVVTLLATGSRGGVLASAIGLLGVFFLSNVRRHGTLVQRLGPLVVVGLVLAGVVALLGGTFLDRIAASGLADTSRMAVDQIVVRSILDAPLSGLGYNTFADVFPLYRDQSISTTGVWDKAHNTYLEVWQGLGLVFGSALIGTLIWLVGLCVLGALRRRRSTAATICASGIGLLVGVHALVDFSVQIQAVSVTFMAVLGAGVAQSTSSQTQSPT